MCSIGLDLFQSFPFFVKGGDLGGQFNSSLFCSFGGNLNCFQFWSLNYLFMFIIVLLSSRC